MLVKDFYTIQSFSQELNIITAQVVINAAHGIFSGHFPGQPVVPGVCMMQVIKELVEQELGYNLIVQRADDMKFLAVIDPEVNNIVDVTIKYSVEADDVIKLTASLFRPELVHFKFKGSFKKETVPGNY